MKKRLLSIVMAAIFLLSFQSVTALAADGALP